MIFPQDDLLRVATLLSGTLHERVYRAVVPPGTVVEAQDGQELAERAAARWSDAAVLEPHLMEVAALPDPDWPDLTPIVAYLRLSPEAAYEAVELARHHSVELLFYGHGDDPASLRHRLLRVRGAPTGRALFRCLEPRLEPLPAHIREGIATLCETASPRDTVATLAAQCCTSEDTLARALRQCGLARPQRLVIAARLVRAHHLLLREDLSAIALAHAFGVASAASLERQLRTVFGTGLRGTRVITSPQELVERAASALVDPAACSTSPAR
jgi:AraC-like DNA-binding protein